MLVCRLNTYQAMKVLVCNLIYGNRTNDILLANKNNAQYGAVYLDINTEGISNALNEGIDFMLENNWDAIAFLANDIIEPNGWLLKKVEALRTYPNAGIVASSLDYEHDKIHNDFIISNWLISKDVINAVGLFNESMFPYGPIDLDYCERTWLAGFSTYYVKNCLAEHVGEFQVNEYGYSKVDMVNKFMPMYKENKIAYKDGSKPIKIVK